jgi:hypothetical protein
MIFKTELDGPATCNTAGVDAAYGIPDNVSRLGAAAEASYPPKRRCLVPIKLAGDPPFDWSIFFPYAQLMRPPPLLFRNLLIPFCG